MNSFLFYFIWSSGTLLFMLGIVEFCFDPYKIPKKTILKIIHSIVTLPEAIGRKTFGIVIEWIVRKCYPTTVTIQVIGEIMYSPIMKIVLNVLLALAISLLRELYELL